MFQLCLAAGLLLGCGCAAGISRQGYTLQDIKNAELANTNLVAACHLAIKNGATYEASEVDILGKIEAFDTSVSVDCDEAYVLDIFCREACALGADFVNLTDEHYPSFWSTCYRAKAEFLRYKNRDQAKLIVSDAKYDPQLIIERSKEQKKRQEAVIIVSAGH
jgi:hypothetical protein